MRWKIIAIIFITFNIILLYFFFLGSQDFDESIINQKEITFISQGEELAATVFLPKKETLKTVPIAIFIHGDGPQNRTSNSEYLPLIHHLLDQGIAVFTWDKKGINGSKGNWLKQSITDRAIEAKDAFDYLVYKKNINPNQIGYLGFSQGGWVIPKAAIITKPAFSIIIGGAVNWLDQTSYYITKKLELEGYNDHLVQYKVDSTRQASFKLFIDLNKCKLTPAEIEKERLLYIARNCKADSSADLQNMQGALLALWGEQDLNVPAKKNAKLYHHLTQKRQSAYTNIKIYPESTHTLLNAKLFNYQHENQWPKWKKWYYQLQGRKAYSKDVLFDISNFILNTKRSTEL